MTSTGRRKKQIVFKPPSFLLGHEYIVSVYVSETNKSSYRAFFAVSVAKGVWIPTFNVTPEVGAVNETFQVTMTRPLGLVRDDYYMLYSLYVNTDAEQRGLGVLISHDLSDVLPAKRKTRHYFPVGLHKHNYTVNVTVVIENVYGSMNSYSNIIQVLPVINITDLQQDEAEAELDNIFNILQDSNSTLELVNVASNLESFRSVQNTTDSYAEKINEARRRIAVTTAKVNISSIYDLEYVSRVISIVEDSVKNTQSDSDLQDSMVDGMQHVADYLLTEQGLLTKPEYEEITTNSSLFTTDTLQRISKNVYRTAVQSMNTVVTRGVDVRIPVLTTEAPMTTWDPMEEEMANIYKKQILMKREQNTSEITSYYLTKRALHKMSKRNVDNTTAEPLNTNVTDSATVDTTANTTEAPINVTESGQYDITKSDIADVTSPAERLIAALQSVQQKLACSVLQTLAIGQTEALSVDNTSVYLVKDNASSVSADTFTGNVLIPTLELETHSLAVTTSAVNPFISSNETVSIIYRALLLSLENCTERTALVEYQLPKSREMNTSLDLEVGRKWRRERLSLDFGVLSVQVSPNHNTYVTLNSSFSNSTSPRDNLTMFVIVNWDDEPNIEDIYNTFIDNPLTRGSYNILQYMSCIQDSPTDIMFGRELHHMYIDTYNMSRFYVPYSRYNVRRITIDIEQELSLHVRNNDTEEHTLYVSVVANDELTVLCDRGTPRDESYFTYFNNMLEQLDNDQQTTLTIDAFAESIECVFWDEEDKTWSNSSCDAIFVKDASFVGCYCDHLSSFSNIPKEVVIQVKYFNTGGAANPVVFLVLCIWAAIFFIITKKARLLDKKDDENWSMPIYREHKVMRTRFIWIICLMDVRVERDIKVDLTLRGYNRAAIFSDVRIFQKPRGDQWLLLLTEDPVLYKQTEIELYKRSGRQKRCVQYVYMYDVSRAISVMYKTSPFQPCIKMHVARITDFLSKSLLKFRQHIYLDCWDIFSDALPHMPYTRVQKAATLAVNFVIIITANTVIYSVLHPESGHSLDLSFIVVIVPGLTQLLTGFVSAWLGAAVYWPLIAVFRRILAHEHCDIHDKAARWDNGENSVHLIMIETVVNATPAILEKHEWQSDIFALPYKLRTVIWVLVCILLTGCGGTCLYLGWFFTWATASLFLCSCCIGCAFTIIITEPLRAIAWGILGGIFGRFRPVDNAKIAYSVFLRGQSKCRTSEDSSGQIPTNKNT